MDIYDMIKSGKSPEDIHKLFAQEYASAKAQVEKEKAEAQAKEQEAKKNALMEEGRAHAINAILAYSEALGEEAPTEAEIQEMAKEFEEMEKLLLSLYPMFKALDKSEKKLDIPTAINEDRTMDQLADAIRGMLGDLM